ncbi:MAG: methyltransferase domain-containing protein [Bacteroidia bacterium]|nr:methyltransferase domain-containing protein [Bacteroidia bacterium]
MHYDPIKRSLGSVFNKSVFLRTFFYRLLDLLLLRSWHIHKEIKKWKNSASANAQIFDAGSGFGQYSFYLAKNNPAYNVYSVDVKQDQINDCNDFFKKAGVTNCLFEVQDLVKYQKPNSFDLILSVDVMEHILEDVQVFKNFSVSLKTGGMLLISTPSDQGGSDVHDAAASSFIEEHVRDGYNIKEIEEKLLSSGFSKVEARYSYGAPGKISWKLSMKYPILMLGISKLFFVLIPFYYLITYPISYILNTLDVNGNHTTGTGLIVKAWK